jgi:tetratricopeptide (TPR) repeat protein
MNFKGQYREAWRQLDRLMRGARNDGERRAAYFAMTVSYADEGNLAKALESQEAMFDLAKRIDDAAAMGGDCFVMGNILLEMGKPDAAAAQFEKSLRIVTQSTLSDDVKNNAKRNYHYNIGRVLAEKKQLAAAKEHASKYLEAAEGIRNTFQIRLAHELLGTIALAEKAYGPAVQELEQANRQNPYNLYRQAKAAAGQGDLEKARGLYAKAAQFNGVNNLNGAFVRKRAAAELKKMM